MIIRIFLLGTDGLSIACYGQMGCSFFVTFIEIQILLLLID